MQVLAEVVTTDGDAFCLIRDADRMFLQHQMDADDTVPNYTVEVTPNLLRFLSLVADKAQRSVVIPVVGRIQ